MARFRQYTMDEIWRPPAEGGESPALTGCPLMDMFVELMAVHGNAESYIYAHRMGISNEALRGAMEALTGMTPAKWIDEWTMRDARWRLLHTRMTVSEIARLAGYSTESNFSAAFRRREKIQPRKFRDRGRTVTKRTVYDIVVDE